MNVYLYTEMGYLEILSVILDDSDELLWYAQKSLNLLCKIHFNISLRYSIV